MASFTIDSNILIYHLKDDAAVQHALEEWLLGENKLFISAITRIEILAAPIMREGEEEKINLLLSQFIMIPVDAQIADIAARVRRMHRLELGDSIIAATALLLNSPIVTRNVRDFKKVLNLEIFPL